MSSAVRPTHQALVDAAIDATGAARGWLLAVEGSELVVVAAGGGPDAAERVGRTRAIAGTTGYALTSGQPAAVRPTDAADTGAGGADALPQALVAVPCGDETILGVLEVVDPERGAFDFDDVEIVGLLAEVAGAALAEVADRRPDVTDPAEVGDALASLAAVDPARYADVVRVVEALLA